MADDELTELQALWDAPYAASMDYNCQRMRANRFVSEQASLTSFPIFRPGDFFHSF